VLVLRSLLLGSVACALALAVSPHHERPLSVGICSAASTETAGGVCSNKYATFRTVVNGEATGRNADTTKKNAENNAKDRGKALCQTVLESRVPPCDMGCQQIGNVTMLYDHYKTLAVSVDRLRSGFRATVTVEVQCAAERKCDTGSGGDGTSPTTCTGIICSGSGSCETLGETIKQPSLCSCTSHDPTDTDGGTCAPCAREGESCNETVGCCWKDEENEGKGDGIGDLTCTEDVCVKKWDPTPDPNAETESVE